MATAIVSALTNKKVDHFLGMTGEITLRGRVLPVGGIKSKILAAHRTGIEKIILSTENKKNLEEIPKEIRKDLEFQTVEHMDEVIATALIEEE
jgi:ATP-dependent Lon protease